MSIRIGTASWSHPALIDTGRFYPSEHMSPEERLHFYATQFTLVEVDSSFYAMTPPGMAQRWVERTPQDFVMNVKAFRLFTGHQTSPQALPAEVREALPAALRDKSILYYRDVPPELRDALWARFVEGIAPLRQAGRLGLVHFQFAPWIVRNPAGRAHIEHCVERMQGHMVSLEFRNFSWFNEANTRDTLAFERSLRVVHTIVDEPQGFANCVPAVWEVTHDDHALVRMHGRNEHTWNKRSNTSSGRFNYQYDDAELEGLAGEIAALDAPSLHLQVVMNNNAEDFAQANGRQLFEALHAYGANVVPPSSGKVTQLRAA
ncbi:DUF72 domain-containing protein [Rhizobacter sp. OV335]|uniref:DUF72 domain-containing protein n=1 Tax=Rhizobacter sp. OV335 TaxID=1500264 RepID=UPI000914C48B|nr:DUF72 domain-containing protein [Rhizobacter sp. OV335]SHN13757.1 Uncharacterized conserved protein YecE, DUF72 family [Rhizobacter sp. OV335]